MVNELVFDSVNSLVRDALNESERLLVIVSLLLIDSDTVPVGVMDLRVAVAEKDFESSEVKVMEPLRVLERVRVTSFDAVLEGESVAVREIVVSTDSEREYVRDSETDDVGSEVRDADAVISEDFVAEFDVVPV